MRAAVGLACAGALLALAGCSLTQSFNDMNRVDYRSATRGPALEVPPDLVSPRADDRLGAVGREATFSSFDRERAAADRARERDRAARARDKDSRLLGTVGLDGPPSGSERT